MIGRLSFLLLLLISIRLYAQDFTRQWTGHFSYTSIKDITYGNDRIYAASENAVFTYDLSTREITTLSTVNGLSGERISAIAYSEDSGLLIIGYENGLIEVAIDGQQNILSVVDILDKQTIPPDRKRINHFNEVDGLLYISADFGISVYDLQSLEFGDSYFIGDLGTQIAISQTTIFEEYIYASSPEGGIRRALIENDNLIDWQQWSLVANANFIGVQTLGSELYAMRTDDRLVRFVPGSGFNFVLNIGEPVVDFISADNLLTITTGSGVNSYSEGLILEASFGNPSGFDAIGQSGYAQGQVHYWGTLEDGLLGIPFGSNNAEQYLPEGPINNRPFSLDSSPGQLWVCFGEVDVDYNPFPLTNRGISNLREGSWTNIPFEDIFETNDLVNVAINPNNPDEVYMTSHNKGLLRIEGQEPVIQYNETNSPLELFRPPERDIRLYGADFDRDGNLWFTQSRVEDGLIRLSPGQQFQKNELTDIIPGVVDGGALGELRISREGYVFFVYDRGGLLGFNPGNAQLRIATEGIGSGNLPVNNVRALEFDQQNRLWIGTLRGLRVLFNVGGFFEEGANIDSQPIIILDDGVPQELLFEQPITDIEVDGSNNKWIATATSGVFYVSSNGQETLLRLNKDNSPLPSDNVQDIAIDPFSGEVFFATTNGLVAYRGTATAPRDNLDEVYAYPNPVRPGFEGNVTIDGLTADANVKITDLEGNLVFEETSQGGSVQWDTRAFGRYKVATGVYLVLITTEDALETKVHKIMIIR